MILTDSHGKKISSQNNEDCIIRTILNVVGEGNRTFVEIGVGNGEECNCINLRRNCGWKGVLVDSCYSNHDVSQKFITAANVQDMLREVNAPTTPTVLSLDIDGNDWYVMHNLGPFLPDAVLVCEFNSSFPNDKCLSIPYDPNFKFGATRFFGASQRAMHFLGMHLNYSLVYSNGVNMFFVPSAYRASFENADAEFIYTPQNHIWPDDPRMSTVVNPFDYV